jgi:competence protein ComEA
MRTRRVAVIALAVSLLALPYALAAESGSSAAEKQRVDINTAGVEELQSLSGIGPALARRIVEHRREHGPFERVEDLLEVKGIGEKTLARFRDKITVSRPNKG